MGSFIGHIDEAIFFIGIAVWWIYIKFPRYIKDPSNYKGELSYKLPCYPRIAIESILKTLFPVCGIIGELANGEGPRFLDENRNFHKLQGLQHMSIYGIFALHGIVDIISHYRPRVLPPGSNYLTISAGFLWYGLAFHWHQSLPGKSPLEQMIHLLPIPAMFLVALVSALELWKGGRFMLNLVRIWALLQLGTWFFHTSFLMYKPWGGEPNPRWDRNNHKNAHFAMALFGYHCIGNMICILVAYALTYVCIKRKMPKASGPTNYEDYDYSSLEEKELLNEV